MGDVMLMMVAGGQSTISTLYKRRLGVFLQPPETAFTASCHDCRRAQCCAHISNALLQRVLNRCFDCQLPGMLAEKLTSLVN
jgi:hypothetical protein